MTDFYEDDEPIEEIRAVMDRAVDFVTCAAPPRGVTLFFGVVADEWTQLSSTHSDALRLVAQR